MQPGKYEDRDITLEEAKILEQLLLRYKADVEDRFEDFDPDGEMEYDAIAAGYVAAQPEATPIMVAWTKNLRYHVTVLGRTAEEYLKR